jgi:hypothetical protein
MKENIAAHAQNHTKRYFCCGIIGRKTEDVRQTELKEFRDKLFIKDKNFPSDHYVPFMKNTGSYT